MVSRLSVEIRAEEILRELPLGPAKMVEVGVHRGALSERLLAAKSDLILYMVDLWEKTVDYPGERSEAFAAATGRTAHYDGRARIVIGDSVAIAAKFFDGVMDLVFIDADHSYEAVKADIAAWGPKVKPGGVLGGHDYRSDKDYGVIQAVDEAFRLASGTQSLLVRDPLMGLRANGLALLLPYLPAKRVLSLSYPDLVMTQQQLEDLTGFRAEAETDSNQWHQVEGKLPETLEVFRRLGTETFRAVDIVASRGCEEIVDLNYPHDLGQWDLVLDPGTTEHCFNIGQALMNAANAVAPGGLILHTPPLSMMNHGFYCLMPTLFNDFYGQNGWECLTLKATDGTTMLDCPPLKRFHASPELSLLALYRRTSGDKLTFPMQEKYRLSPGL